MPRYTEWCDGLARDLAAPFPSDWIKQKKAGGRSISFVSWHLYVHRLNELVGPGWSMGTPILSEVGGKLVMGLPVTILGVTRVNFGSEEEEHGNADEDGKVRDYGSAETNAFAQALKRTLALFGMGLSLYDKDGVMRTLTPQQREHLDILDYLRINGENAPPELQARIRREWAEAKTKYAVAATLCGLVEEAGGPKFQPPA
jgi:hypothetical protein